MTTVQVGRWTYHFAAPEGLVIDVVPVDDTAPNTAEVMHWPAVTCQRDDCHPVGECGIYDHITMPVKAVRV